MISERLQRRESLTDRAYEAPSVVAARQRGHNRVPVVLRTALWLVVAWALVVGVTMIKSPGFLGGQTVVAIAFNMAFVGTMAVGVSIVMKSGAELDLSIGMNAAASALLLASLMGSDWSFLLAFSVSILFGALIGVVNSVLIVGMGMHPIVGTLGMMFLLMGAMQLVTDFVPVPSDSFPRTHLSGLFLGLPTVFWIMLVLLLVVEAVIEFTRPGRHLVAVGGSASAAQVRGISRRRVQSTAFVACGAMGSVAGLVLVAQTSVVQTELAVGIEFQVIAILLLGGIALTGGRGRLVGLLAALLLISTVPTAIVRWGISSNWQQVIEGLILAGALAFESLRRARNK